MNFNQKSEGQIEAYLNRIHYKGPLDGSSDTLARLQYNHLHFVPYENLDIRRNIPISLDIQDLFDKIVVRKRGGYCFELNALFSWLLRELGFQVTDLMARFWRDEPNPPPMRRHQVMQVEVEGALYVCDVGVGGIVPRWPLLRSEGNEQIQGDEIYRLDQDLDYGWMLLEKKQDDWRPIYSFTEEPQLPKDFIMPSYWCEHSPDSVFVNNNIIAIRTEDGRNTIAGDEFRLFTSGGVRTFTPKNEQEYKDALKAHFGIILD